MTALALACKNQKKFNPIVVVELLKKGANPNIPNNKGTYPIHYVAKAGHADMVELLMLYGASIDKKDENTQTVLLLASNSFFSNSLDNLPIFEELLINGADPNIPNDYMLSYPLHYAVAYNFTEVIEMLLLYDAVINVRNKNGSTPLLRACFRRKFNIQILQTLLTHDADPNISNNQGTYPLHYCAEAGYLDGVKTLLCNNAQVNISNNHGNTPLSFACQKKGFFKVFNLKVIEELLVHGADPNLLNNEGKSPLDYALEAEYNDAIDRLLFYGAVKK